VRGITGIRVRLPQLPQKACPGSSGAVQARHTRGGIIRAPQCPQNSASSGCGVWHDGHSIETSPFVLGIDLLAGVPGGCVGG
jgi:hypothetical protein